MKEETNMRIKKILPWIMAVLIVAGGIIWYIGTHNGDGGNQPYEPPYPAPNPHEGLFESEYGTMEFNGDGSSIKINFNATLAQLAGLPEGPQEGTYRFLSGDLPPNGSVEVRYDTAHELEITIGQTRAVLKIGEASADGKSATVGIGTVKEDRIPLVFNDGKNFTVEFINK